MSPKPLIWFDGTYWCCGQKKGFHVQRYNVGSAYLAYTTHCDWIRAR